MSQYLKLALFVALFVHMCLTYDIFNHNDETKRIKEETKEFYIQSKLFSPSMSKMDGNHDLKASNKHRSASNGAVVTTRGDFLTQEEKDAYVDAHNFHRYNVDPPAANMKKMKWDTLLPMNAQQDAEQCNWDQSHDYVTEYNLGENKYLTPSTDRINSIVQGVEYWSKEKNQFSYDTNSCAEGEFADCSHYTQVIWADSEYIGCGIHYCSSVNGLSDAAGTYHVCIYGPKINDDGVKPHTKLEACDACPEGTTMCENRFIGEPLCTPTPEALKDNSEFVRISTGSCVSNGFHNVEHENCLDAASSLGLYNRGKYISIRGGTLVYPYGCQVVDDIDAWDDGYIVYNLETSSYGSCGAYNHDCICEKKESSECSHCYDYFEGTQCKIWSVDNASCVTLSEKYHCSTEEELYSKCTPMKACRDDINWVDDAYGIKCSHMFDDWC